MNAACDIACSARQQALDDLAAEAKAERERLQAEEQRKHEIASATFDAGVVVLDEWFPGVQWRVVEDRSGRGSAAGYGTGFEVIVMEQDAAYSDDLKLMIERRLIDMNEPGAGYRVKIYLVSEKVDSGTSYTYWDGPEVRSAADVGRWLYPEVSAGILLDTGGESTIESQDPDRRGGDGDEFARRFPYADQRTNPDR